MKERPILFSGAMVRAILAGQKTQTRRVLSAAIPLPTEPGYELRFNGSGASLVREDRLGTSIVPIGRMRYGAPGDRLWVRETWATRNDVVPASAKAKHYLLYRADGGDLDSEWHHYDRWRPSIHMPRWASRITLDVTEVRVQRLQEISEDDARAEGVSFRTSHPFRRYPSLPPTARDAFAALWDSINGKRPGCSWDANPWIWAVSFKRAEPAQ